VYSRLRIVAERGQLYNKANSPKQSHEKSFPLFSSSTKTSRLPLAKIHILKYFDQKKKLKYTYYEESSGGVALKKNHLIFINFTKKHRGNEIFQMVIFQII